jgi:dimethylamine monooxygenase subunit A
VTEHYAAEIELKQRLLAEDLENYFAALPGSEPAQQEAASLVARCAGKPLQSGDDSLLSMARLVQEDLVVLSGDSASGHPVIAGVVCFPSGWTIREKLGQTILSVHRPVPEYATVMGASTDKLLSQLKAGRPVWRMNWGVRASGDLDQSPKHLLQQRREISEAGSQCYFRVERQTLSRLPESGAILFTIHTHQCQLAELASWQQSNLLGVLQSCPEETLQYKGIARIWEPVCRFLRSELGR